MLGLSSFGRKDLHVEPIYVYGFSLFNKIAIISRIKSAWMPGHATK